MEVQMFLTQIPKSGLLGPWIPIARTNRACASSIRVTAFRVDGTDRLETAPIWGEFSWCDHPGDRDDRAERFNNGMMEVVLFANAPAPQLRFDGEGAAGSQLRVLIQIRDLVPTDGHVSHDIPARIEAGLAA